MLVHNPQGHTAHARFHDSIAVDTEAGGDAEAEQKFKLPRPSARQLATLKDEFWWLAGDLERPPSFGGRPAVTQGRQRRRRSASVPLPTIVTHEEDAPNKICEPSPPFGFLRVRVRVGHGLGFG